MLRRINLQLFGEQDPDNTKQAGSNEENVNGNDQKESQSTDGESGGTADKKDNAEDGEQGKPSSAKDQKGTETKGQPQGQQTTETQAQNGNDDFSNLLMRAQLNAYKEGKFDPKAVEDAVVLAVHDARSKGEVTEESIKTALDNVLQRNPAWAKKTESEGGTGFKVGADGTEGAGPIENDVLIPKKSWNRHK